MQELLKDVIYVQESDRSPREHSLDCNRRYDKSENNNVTNRKNKYL